MSSVSPVEGDGIDGLSTFNLARPLSIILICASVAGPVTIGKLTKELFPELRRSCRSFTFILAWLAEIKANGNGK